MKHISEMIDKYIADTGMAKRVVQDGRAGVIFLDEENQAGGYEQVAQ